MNENKQKLKKAARVLLIVAGILIAGAVIVGVLNALIADGKWTFGWTDYRYDDTGYEIGGGTVPGEIREIFVDWVDGEVAIEACEDTYLSLTETVEGELTESGELRWFLDGDGKLTVMYRKSSRFLSLFQNKDKHLIVRVPVRMMEKLGTVEVRSSNGNISVRDLRAAGIKVESEDGIFVSKGCDVGTLDCNCGGGITFEGTVTDRGDLESRKGNITLESSTVCPAETTLRTTKGEVRVALPENAGFALLFESDGGKYTSDFALTEREGKLIAGSGGAILNVTTGKGDLTLTN